MEKKSYSRLDFINCKIDRKKIEAYTTYCIELTEIVSSSANIDFHIRLLIQNYIRRNFIENFSSLVEKAKEETTDVFDLLDDSLNCLHPFFLNNQQVQKVSGIINEFTTEYANSGKPIGIQSSLNIINKAFGG